MAACAPTENTISRDPPLTVFAHVLMRANGGSFGSNGSSCSIGDGMDGAAISIKWPYLGF